MLRSALIVLVCVAAPSAAAGVHAQDTVPPAGAGEPRAATLTPDRTGVFSASLPERAPESRVDRWVERFRFPGDLRGWDYDLSEERFALYVPPGYEADGEPWGVLVWVSPFDNGGVPSRFMELLEERRLIWIGADGAGNTRHLFHRSGLALDAAANISERYNVDPDRIFVSGLSGGGKVAAMLAVDYPDVFAGGFAIVGVTTYLDLPLDSDPLSSVQSFPRPSPELLEQAKSQPLVVLTGSDDFNREESRLTAEAYTEDGFTEVHLLDLEGMGHEMPSAESFARGLDLLLGGG